MLYDTLKKENMLALKNKEQDKRGILSIVINKCLLLSIDKRTTNQELTDGDVLTIINKTIKELDEEATMFNNAGRSENATKLWGQMEYLKTFLPKQLTEEEIKAEIEKLEDKSVPSIMKYFKANYNGLCDMKLVNQLAKSYQ